MNNYNQIYITYRHQKSIKRARFQFLQKKTQLFPHAYFSFDISLALWLNITLNNQIIEDYRTCYCIFYQ